MRKTVLIPILAALALVPAAALAEHGQPLCPKGEFPVNCRHKTMCFPGGTILWGCPIDIERNITAVHLDDFPEPKSKPALEEIEIHNPPLPQDAPVR
jgi:hypothetical protein